MVGVIWVVQLVIYPLFDSIGEERFEAFHQSYMSRITWIVGPAMLIEIVTGALCCFVFWNDSLRYFALLNFGLIGAIWLSTALLQVADHNALSQNFSSEAVKNLVSRNWIRTILWSLHLGTAIFLGAKR